MRVYIAAPWDHKADAARVAETLRDEGHFVQSIWHDSHQDTDDPMILAREANVDFVGVISSDVCLVLNYHLSEGKAVEQGIAISYEVPIIVVGEKRSNIFHYLPVVMMVQTEEAAVEELRRRDALVR